MGYGDKSRVTLVGRALGLIWMFAAIIITSFTAIASALTVNQLTSWISGPADLPKVKVGTVEPSAGAKYLATRRIAFTGFQGHRRGDRRVGAGRRGHLRSTDPAVRDPRQGIANLAVLDGTFDNRGYAFALETCSPYRELQSHDARVPRHRRLAGDLARYLGH